jgi:2-polyprenyl-6-methoxyphenol hydroxylase-like FAD-dependent oxidoreductase
MRIAVIGAGVAGSLVVDMLRDVPGIEVKAFERVDPGAHQEAGTGLNLGPNALKALRLYRPTTHAALRANSLPWQHWFVDLADGTRLFDLDLLEVAEEPGVRLRWADLYRLLREPVAGCTAYGHALEALEEDAQGRLVPVFRTGAGLVRDGGFDLLVAGDGRYSQLRHLTAGVPPYDFKGIGMWRVLVPDASDCPFEDYGQWFQGSNRLLAYGLPGGAGYIAGSFHLDSIDGEILPKHRTPEYQAGLFIPEDGRPCAAVAWMNAQIHKHFDEMHWARLQLSPVERQAAGGRVLFLGDSAHAMVPTLGQGATQAIEDGVLAGGILARGGGVAEIGALRDPRIDFVRDFSVEASDTLFPGADPVEGTKKKMGADFMGKLRRLYTEVPEPGTI